MIYKLFSVQIWQCDLYTALASSQQQMTNELKPARGQIYFMESVGGQEKLYPAATNKDFYSLYAVPKELPSPTLLAEQVYQFFDLPAWQKANSPVSATASATAPTIASSTAAEMVAARLARFSRPNSLYELIDNRLDDSQLLKFYALVANASATLSAGAAASSTPGAAPISSDDLMIKDEKVVYKNASSTELKIPGLGFISETQRYYPDNELAAQVLGFVSYADNPDGQGKYGLEEFFNDELFGKYGSVKADRAAGGRTIIISGREYAKPEDGSNLILTIDRNIEFVACDKLKEAVKKHGAAGGSVIIMQPQTGAILAMCSVPDFNPNDYQAVKDLSVFNNPALLYQYEPGSVFKTVTMSAAIDQGKVSPSTTYNDTGETMIAGWPKPIKNSDFSTKGAHGVTDMNGVLENSLNLGAIFAMKQIGPKVFADYVKSYGFGERTGIELGSESPGNIGNLFAGKVKEIDAAVASFGQGIAVTPLQMIMPYQAIANGGVLMKPYVVKEIVHADGSRQAITPQPTKRVVSQKTADTIKAMLVNVVEKGHAKGVRVSGYYIGGKTGTAQTAMVGGYSQDKYIHTFISIGPIENPVFVMLMKMDDPKDAQYAESTVVPASKDIVDFIFKYYQVPKTRS